LGFYWCFWRCTPVKFCNQAIFAWMTCVITKTIETTVHSTGTADGNTSKRSSHSSSVHCASGENAVVRIYKIFVRPGSQRPTPDQRLLESHFQAQTPLLFPKFWIRIRVRVGNFFKFENPSLVQTPVIIDATDIQQCVYLKKWRLQRPHRLLLLPKMSSDSGSGSENKRRILMESTPALRIRGHLYSRHTRTAEVALSTRPQPDKSEITNDMKWRAEDKQNDNERTKQETDQPELITTQRSQREVGSNQLT